jgi:hypothetical protein
MNRPGVFLHSICGASVSRFTLPICDMPRLERAQRVHHLIEPDALPMAGWHPLEIERRLLGADKGSPSGQNGSLLPNAEIGMIDDFRRIDECGFGAQEHPELGTPLGQATTTWRRAARPPSHAYLFRAENPAL